MDEKDKQILEILEEDSSLTTREIAKKTRVPITTVHLRIKKLKEEGIIKKFTIEIDPKKIEKGFSAYILISVNLSLLKEKKKSQYDIAKELRKFYFVEKVNIVSGGTDLIAYVRVKDVEEFDKVLLGKLQLVEGVENTQSLIVIS